ncbi:MAG: ABC transporter permease [Caldilineaceae bacterium]|nr:ABC transporter permease [Caldilineaceae bacterium]MCB9138126.1 ABC transporter permease [Caldilineaceae bacterium]
MNNILTIARHEYMVNIRRPGFIFTTLLIPALGTLALLIGSFFAGQAGAFFSNVFESESKPVGVVDHAGLFTPILPEYADEYLLYTDEDQARQAVTDDEILRLIVIPATYPAANEVEFVTTETGIAAIDIEDSGSLDRFFIAHLLRNEADPTLSERVLDPYAAQVVNPEGETEGMTGVLNIILGFVVPYVLSIFLIITIFTTSGYLLRSVAEEKSNRVIEVLLSSVSPQDLLAGKVIGLGALGLTQILVWIVAGFGLSGGVVSLLGVMIPLFARPWVFVLAVLYYLLGFILFAVLMGSVGALGSDMQESQQLGGVFTFIAAVPLMFAGLIFPNPNGLIARIFSWFPLTAPTTMMLRLPLSDVPVLDIIISIAGLLITIPFAIWLGGKLFRLGLLMYGKRPTVREIWRQLRAS